MTINPENSKAAPGRSKADEPLKLAKTTARKVGAHSKANPIKAQPNQRSAPSKPSDDKGQRVLKRLKASKGVTIAQLADETGWQAHSVRAFLSATVRKKLGLKVLSETGKDNIRRYRIPT